MLHPMTDEPHFVNLQREFARHLRDPDRIPVPGTHDERRMAVYRNAIYSNVARFMADNYPRVRAVMNDLRWQAMVRDYIIRHVSRTGIFVELPLEFLRYLETERCDPEDPPFLYELAHFDWLETLVGADPRVLSFDDVVRDGDLLADVPVVNPTLRLHTYAYPVHAITAEFQPRLAPAQATRIAAFRDPDNLYGFLDLSPAAAGLIEAIQDNRGLNGQQILTRMAATCGYGDSTAFVAAGSTILARMHARGALLGVAA
ncbi:MAG: putative DNA-binding domain-containing protein [Gammaproteobacteria bacterium]